MALFLASTSLLLLLVLYAVLRPLLVRNASLAIGLAVLTIAATTLLYLKIGTPDALNPQLINPPTTLAEARMQLQHRLRREPDLAEAWVLLARTYSAEQRRAEAAEALTRAARLAPQDPDILTEAALAHAARQSPPRFDEQAINWLDQAVKLAPQNQQARWFLGAAHRQNGKPAEAARIWEPLLKLADANARTALLTEINAARAEAGQSALAAPTDTSAAGIRITLQIAPALAERLHNTPQAQIFVMARAINGSPMPIAVERHRPDALSLDLVLDDNDSPMPTQKLSEQTEVEVLARLSASGSVTRQPGDIETPVQRIRLPSDATVHLQLKAPPLKNPTP